MARDRERSRSRDRHRRDGSRRSYSPDRRGSFSSHRRHRDEENHDHRRRDYGRSTKRPRESEDFDMWEEKKSSDRKKDRRSSHSERRRENATPSDDDDLLDIRQMGIRPISEEDYFAKSAEFKYWLKDARDKDFHDMSSEQTHRYFRRFVRRWNDGALRGKYYNEPPRSPNTSIARWGTDRDVRAAKLVDDDDRSPSPGPRLDPGPGQLAGSSQIGPTLPSVSDRQMALEAQREADSLARKAERSATRRTALERAEEVAPRLQGKEGKMAEKRATNSANKEMRDKEVGGLELDEKTLMGEESSFQAALRARDAASARRRDKKDAEMASMRSANEERLAERRQKESETMQMLQAMAKQRYG